MSIYVNREQKISYYKSQYPDIDPLPRIQKMVENAPKMSDRQFHYNMTQIFNSLRDHHTYYYMPPPHSCYQFESGIKLRLGESSDVMNPTMYLSGKTTNSKVLDLSPELSQAKIGDQLIAVDGVPFAQFAKQKAFEFGGANDFGAMRAAQTALYFRYGDQSIPPENNEQKLTFKTQSGKEYTITLPWVAVVDTQCLKKAPSSSIPSSSRLSRSTASHLMAYSPSFKVEKTDDEAVSWGIFDPKDSKLGVIFLENFDAKSGVEGIMSVIQNLLTNQLKQTRAVVFDIRRNPGGVVEFAQRLPQLFSKDIVRPLYRAINNEINEEIFAKARLENQWTTSTIGQKGKYTSLEALTAVIPEDQVVYTKPVGVFVSAVCYSACDLFSAIMQDSKIAKIYGEDPNTGAGGSNFVTTSILKTFGADEKLFPNLPFPNQEFGLAWRQMVRQGPSNGKLIEDYGVKVDMVVRPRLQDVLENSSRTQWQRIANDLLKA